MKNLHPGEILNHEFIKPSKITAIDVARAISVTQGRMSEIIRGKRGVTADTAIRLGIFFGTSAEYWLGLQNNYNLKKEFTNNQKEYKKIKPFKKD
jgi:addiction module HigA family antidote